MMFKYAVLAFKYKIVIFRFDSYNVTPPNGVHLRRQGDHTAVKQRVKYVGASCKQVPPKSL